MFHLASSVPCGGALVAVADALFDADGSSDAVSSSGSSVLSHTSFIFSIMSNVLPCMCVCVCVCIGVGRVGGVLHVLQSGWVILNWKAL